jgi:hypothetical protein
MCEKCEEIDRRIGHLDRMIEHVEDPQTVAAANTLIDEMKAMKAKLHPPKQMQIVRRAYKLWQEAGEPQGKDEEFYYLAEQQLRDEVQSSPLRTPDNL